MDNITWTCKAFEELTLKELYDTMVLRQEVFTVEQDCVYLDADGKDPLGHHVLGYRGTDLVAYTRLLPKGISYEHYPSIGRVVTSQSVRRTGIGITLMQKSIHYIQKVFDAKAIKISAQTYLLRFYKGLGFEPVGEEYLEDGIPHVAMIR